MLRTGIGCAARRRSLFFQSAQGGKQIAIEPTHFKKDLRIPERPSPYANEFIEDSGWRYSKHKGSVGHARSERIVYSRRESDRYPGFCRQCRKPSTPSPATALWRTHGAYSSGGRF